MIRVLRWLLGGMAVGLALHWCLVALRGRRPSYGVDPATGLVLRIGPLSPAERRDALEREAASADVRV